MRRWPSSSSRAVTIPTIVLAFADFARNLSLLSNPGPIVIFCIPDIYIWFLSRISCSFWVDFWIEPFANFFSYLYIFFSSGIYSLFLADFFCFMKLYLLINIHLFISIFRTSVSRLEALTSELAHASRVLLPRRLLSQLGRAPLVKTTSISRGRGTAVAIYDGAPLTTRRPPHDVNIFEHTQSRGKRGEEKRSLLKINPQMCTSFNLINIKPIIDTLKSLQSQMRGNARRHCGWSEREKLELAGALVAHEKETFQLVEKI